MSLQFNDILQDVSYVLVETVVNTTLGTSIPAGSQTVTPGSMDGIYQGAILQVGGASPEQVTVTAVTATTFTAVFANSHLNTDPLTGATFPSGQPNAPLFTQTEMIEYLSEVQNDFLLKVRPLYAISLVSVTPGIRFYSQPATAIRVERIAVPIEIEGYGEGPYGEMPYGGGFEILQELYETSQSNLDLIDPLWPEDQGTPRDWFRDQIATGMFGFHPLPSTNLAAEVWYSYRGQTSSNTMDTLLLVPDVFGHFLKYGVLNRAFSKDGEFRDPKRADYCMKRYQLGIFLALKFMSGAGVNMDRGAIQDTDFQPMPLQAGK